MKDQGLHTMFQNSTVRGGNGLSERVWLAVEQRIERRRRMKLWLYGSLSFVSLAALVPASMMLVNEVTSSGFIEYLSLATSHVALTSSLKELSLVLIETAPAMPVTVLLFLIVTLLSSLRGVARTERASLQIA